MADIIRGSKLEKDFIERTYASIVSDISIAFSELAANSWDAGAALVSITLPSWESDLIINVRREAERYMGELELKAIQREFSATVLLQERSNT